MSKFVEDNAFLSNTIALCYIKTDYTNKTKNICRQSGKLKVDKQRPYNQVVHGVIGMSVIVQILVEIPAFSSEVFIEGPTEARKSAVLIEAGLAANLSEVKNVTKTMRLQVTQR